jgi:hypothetical protein
MLRLNNWFFWQVSCRGGTINAGVVFVILCSTSYFPSLLHSRQEVNGTARWWACGPETQRQQGPASLPERQTARADYHQGAGSSVPDVCRHWCLSTGMHGLLWLWLLLNNLLWVCESRLNFKVPTSSTYTWVNLKLVMCKIVRSFCAISLFTRCL